MPKAVPLLTRLKLAADSPAARALGAGCARLLPALWVAAVVGFLYAPSVIEDVGILSVSDDAMILASVADGLSPRVLFTAHGDHLIPATRLVYFLCLKTFGLYWLPYAALLLAAFGTMCWMVAACLHRITGSRLIAFLVLAPFSLSPLLASAPTLQFQYLFSMAQMILCLSAVLILVNRAERPRPIHLWLLAACTLTSVLISSPGLIILPLVMMCATALRFAARPAQAPLNWATLRDWADLPVVKVVTAVVIVYAGAYLYGVHGLGNLPIGGTSYGRTPSHLSPMKRVINFHRYGFFGAAAPADAGDQVYELRFRVGGTRDVIAPRWLALLIPAMLAVFLADLWWKHRRGESGRRPLSELGIVFLGVGFLFAVLAVRARVYILYWQAVYVEPIVVFSALAIGLLLATCARRLTGRARLLAAAAAVLGFGFLAWQNALALRERIPWCIENRSLHVQEQSAPGERD